MRHELRILLVEDLPEAREALKSLLEIWGHHVEVASDGEQALTLGGFRDFDVVISDLELPRLNGYGVGRHFAAKQPRPFLIAYSAFSREEDRKRTRQAGFDAHIGKGMSSSIPDLQRLLEELRSGCRNNTA
jgi:two-component system, sensor histidine kinase